MKRRLPIFVLIFISTFTLFPTPSFAFRSSSDNFVLEGEFGIFGSAKSSTNYGLQDTGGGFAPGYSGSDEYAVGSGFQYVQAEQRMISFTIDEFGVSLGKLETSLVKFVPRTTTVITNGAGGYNISITEDDDLRNDLGDTISDVGDGEINAGTEEYGVATSKSGQQVVQDTDCASAPYNASSITHYPDPPKTVASYNKPTPTTGDDTTICFAASVDDLTEAGSYSQLVTLIATGTF